MQPLASAGAAALDKGLALENLRNYTGAVKYYDKALAINPNHTYALDNKGIKFKLQKSKIKIKKNHSWIWGGQWYSKRSCRLRNSDVS
ncbi:MAG: tetratricopeptide repeat protein [Candidatus Nitrosopolaris sp.]